MRYDHYTNTVSHFSWYYLFLTNTNCDKNQSDGSFSCFLWQQSFFYNKARIDLNAWQLRWFTFTSNGIESKLSKSASKQDHSFKYLSISNVEVDEDHLLIKLHRTKSNRRPCK